MGCGAGIIIDSRGYIVTCNHVVKTQRNLRVVFYGREHSVKATWVGADEANDIAVLKVTPARPLDTIVFGQSRDLMIGETVYAIGNPHNHTHTFSIGIVSGPRRTVSPDDDPNIKIARCIQVDASVMPGNSGGVLLNVDGEMIGMCEAADDAIGFATPVETIISSAKRIMRVQEFQ